MSGPLTVVVVADPLEGLAPAHDTSVALMEEAQRRGHHVLSTTAARLRIRHGRAWARCRPTTLVPATLTADGWRADPDWYRTDAEVDVMLDDADVVMMRTDPPVDAAYLRATYVLDAVDRRRVLLVNAPTGLREANEKLFTLRYPQLVPDTLVSGDRHEILDAVHRWGRAVLKPTDGMAGRGIMQLHPDDPNLCSIVESATERGRTQVIVQAYVAAADDGDRRVIIVDGEPVGAVRRVAAAGEFRCNMAAGAAVLADEVGTYDRQIAKELAPELERLGIVFCGIDVLGDRLTEVNVTSPTGLREIAALSDPGLAATVTDRLEDVLERMRR